MNWPSPLKLSERSATAVRKIPAGKLHIFCASCAERFFDGYAEWLADEIRLDARTASLPSPDFVRRAIDTCWKGADRTEVNDLLRTLSGMMPGDDEQPIFKSRLSDYFDEAPRLVELGLSSLLDPKVEFSLKSSAAALDFHWQLLIRRTEKAGGPAFDDPEWDRLYETDPGAVAESALQIRDAEELQRGLADLKAMRNRSADNGRDALAEVRRRLGLTSS